jgi:hypothetical protein
MAYVVMGQVYCIFNEVERERYSIHTLWQPRIVEPIGWT